MITIKANNKSNVYFNSISVGSYLLEYAKEAYEALRSIDLNELDRAKELMKAKRVFIGGNGGSLAISDHWTCDFEKGSNRSIVSLVGRPALLTAIANDYGYEHTLSWQLIAAKCDAWDTVVLISSSGNSPNIIEAAKFAKSQGSKVLGLTGFDGGALKRISDVNLHIGINNYGVVEDCHQMLMHVLAQYHWIKDGSKEAVP